MNGTHWKTYRGVHLPQRRSFTAALLKHSFSMPRFCHYLIIALSHLFLAVKPMNPRTYTLLHAISGMILSQLDAKSIPLTIGLTISLLGKLYGI